MTIETAAQLDVCINILVEFNSIEEVQIAEAFGLNISQANDIKDLFFDEAEKLDLIVIKTFDSGSRSFVRSKKDKIRAFSSNGGFKGKVEGQLVSAEKAVDDFIFFLFNQKSSVRLDSFMKTYLYVDDISKYTEARDIIEQYNLAEPTKVIGSYIKTPKTKEVYEAGGWIKFKSQQQEKLQKKEQKKEELIDRQLIVHELLQDKLLFEEINKRVRSEIEGQTLELVKTMQKRWYKHPATLISCAALLVTIISLFV